MVGKGIRFIRKSRGMTQIDLAKKINIAPSAIARYEMDRQVPSKKRIHEFADALNVCPLAFAWYSITEDEIFLMTEEDANLFGLMKPSFDELINKTLIYDYETKTKVNEH